MMQKPLFLPYVQIQSPRLTLRSIEPKYFREMYHLYRNNREHLNQFFWWSHRPETEEEFAVRYSFAYGHYFAAKECQYGIWEGEKLVGSTFFFPVDLLRHSLMREIGYWVDSHEQNRGIATHATQMLLVLLLDYLRIDRIQIRCSCANKPSRRVIEKCGFQFEGRLRNMMEPPDPSMLSHGYTSERDYFIFSLIPADIAQLPWFTELRNTMRFIDVHGTSHQL